MAEPLDFELEIGPAGDAGYPVTARVTGGGEASEVMSWPMTGRELDAQLAAIRDSVLASSATVRRLSTLDEQPVRELGQRLFDAAISNQIRVLYAAAYQQSRRQDRPLRLVLRIRPPELARLPWEYLFDRTDDTYLGLRMPLVRYAQVLEPQRPLKVSPPLNILAMVARPGDQTAKDVRSQKRRLGTALTGLERAGQVKLTWVRGQSWRDLRTILDTGVWHVFHFIGHGGYDAGSGEGVLALAGEEGGTAPLGAGAFSMVLSENPALRLVVLNACDTGRSSSLDSFSSVAGALVRRGIPAILAMQFEITDRAAIEFTRTFYEELAHRRPVDAGAMRARQAIYIAQNNSLEWGTPVLYLRSSDGQIFDFSEAGMHEQRSAQRDRQTVESGSLRTRYAEGLAAFYTDRWDEAVAIFRELLAEDPDYPGAALKLEQALRQASLVASYTEAMEAVRESRWKDAVEGLEAVLAVDAGYRDASQRLDVARTQQTIAGLQDEARRLYDAQHWEAVVRIGEQLSAIDRRSADPDGMVTEARRLLEVGYDEPTSYEPEPAQPRFSPRLGPRSMGAALATLCALVAIWPLSLTRSQFDASVVSLVGAAAVGLTGACFMRVVSRIGKVLGLVSLAVIVVTVTATAAYRLSGDHPSGVGTLSLVAVAVVALVLAPGVALVHEPTRKSPTRATSRQSIVLAVAAGCLAIVPGTYAYFALPPVGTGTVPASQQFLVATRDGQLKHTLRYADGHWEPAGDAGAPGIGGQVQALAAASGGPGEVQFLVAMQDGQLKHTIRYADGQWQPAIDAAGAAGISGQVQALAAASGGD